MNQGVCQGLVSVIITSLGNDLSADVVVAGYVKTMAHTVGAGINMNGPGVYQGVS